MRGLTKNLILATAVVSAIFIVDFSCAGAASLHYETTCSVKKICPFSTDNIEHLDFWGKFRDTVMPDPDKPQNNNPPKEMRRPPPVKHRQPPPILTKPPPKPAD